MYIYFHQLIYSSTSVWCMYIYALREMHHHIDYYTYIVFQLL